MIQEYVPLSLHTTFGIGGTARYFAHIHTTDELVEAYTFAEKNNLPVILLGGGSNTLVTDGVINALVLKISILGISREDAQGDTVVVTAGAGVAWDELVEYAVSEHLYGIELLTLIPGTVGAAVVQNIGAYGTELKEVVNTVEVFNTETKKIQYLTKEDCVFGYRDSLFKKNEGKKFVITRVIIQLLKNAQLNLSYKDVQEYFKENKEPTLSEVRSAIIDIRTKKLPDPKIIGTAGSFFKNPTVSKEKYHELCSRFPELPGFVQNDGRVKISLAWILDHALKLKGFSVGGARLHEHQPLVIVAEKNTPSNDVLKLVSYVQEKVKKEFEIEIEKEVVVIQN